MRRTPPAGIEEADVVERDRRRQRGGGMHRFGRRHRHRGGEQLVDGHRGGLPDHALMQH